MSRKPVIGFEGKYEVSDSGKVYSIPRMRKGKGGALTPVAGCELKQHLDHSGYPTVCLRDGNKSFNRSVHRLVAEAFVKNPLEKTAVNHIDEDKTNNSASNLEWVTTAENNIHGTRLDSLRRRVRRLPDGVEYRSIADAARAMGVSKASIRDALIGKSKTSCGYKWEYCEPKEGSE